MNHDPKIKIESSARSLEFRRLLKSAFLMSIKYGFLETKNKLLIVEILFWMCLHFPNDKNKPCVFDKGAKIQIGFKAVVSFLKFPRLQNQLVSKSKFARNGLFTSVYRLKQFPHPEKR